MSLSACHYNDDIQLELHAVTIVLTVALSQYYFLVRNTSACPGLAGRSKQHQIKQTLQHVPMQTAMLSLCGVASQCKVAESS
jgi:hypothetical protein